MKTPKPIQLLKAAVRLMEHSPDMEMKHAEHVRHIRNRYHVVEGWKKRAV